MSDERNMQINVASYLARHGWHRASRGPAGELWALGDDLVLEGLGRTEELTLAVPDEFEFQSFEYQGIVERLARVAHTGVDALSFALEGEFLDAQNYRIKDRYVIEDAAQLDSAATMLGSARRLTRAAATTSRKPRARIGQNYSPPGDELAQKARLAHTRHGSFILPVVMPVDPPAAEEQTVNDLGPVEPGERAVTRTIASALAALDTIAIKPDREPTPDDVMNLVTSGVSKEFVVAVRDIISKGGVDAFDVSFEWAPALAEPKNVPERVVIVDDARTLLDRVATTLGKTRDEPDASVSGQIVRIHYVQDDPMGEVAIRTERRNRVVDVQVTVTAEIIHQAYDWARDHRPVIVRGRIVRSPGRPVWIPEPTSDLMPIDRLFVGDLGDVQAG